LDQIAKVFAYLGTPSGAHWPAAKQLPHGQLKFVQKPPQDISDFVPRSVESPGLVDFLQSSIALDPSRRFSSADAVNHAWLQQGLACRLILQQDLIPSELDEPFLFTAPDADLTNDDDTAKDLVATSHFFARPRRRATEPSDVLSSNQAYIYRGSSQHSAAQRSTAPPPANDDCVGDGNCRRVVVVVVVGQQREKEDDELSEIHQGQKNVVRRRLRRRQAAREDGCVREKVRGGTVPRRDGRRGHCFAKFPRVPIPRLDAREGSREGWILYRPRNSRLFRGSRRRKWFRQSRRRDDDDDALEQRRKE